MLYYINWTNLSHTRLCSWFMLSVFECNKNAIYWLSQKSTYANCKVPIFYYHNYDELALAKSLYSLLLLQCRWTSFYKIVGFSVHKHKFSAHIFFLFTDYHCWPWVPPLHNVSCEFFGVYDWVEYYLPPELKNAF